MSTDISPSKGILSRRWVLMSSVAIVTLALFFAAIRLAGGSFGEGSLKGPESVITEGLYLDRGGVATWGSVLVRNSGRKPLTLDGVDLQHRGHGVPAAIPVLRLQVVREQHMQNGAIGMAFGSGDKIIPESRRAGLKGFRLKPGERVAILVQYQARENGQWRYDSMRVNYHESWRSRHLSLQQAMEVCVPSKAVCAMADS
jgi:hypothetical protein